MKDLALRKAVRECPCICCIPGQQTYPTECHHVTTRGAAGDDDRAENMVPLCSAHHVEIHRGKITFMRKYRAYREWLRLAGRDDVLGQEAYDQICKEVACTQ